MKPDALCVVMLQTVIESLVIAEVEPVLLQFPLKVPIRLRYEEEAGMLSFHRRDDVSPVLCRGSEARATPPGAFEDCIQQKHRHVATYAVALAGYVPQSCDHCLSQPRLKSIELQHIRPCGEIGVPAASVDSLMYLNVRRWVLTDIFGSPLNEVLRMLVDPGVIRRYVVGHKIEDETHAALSKFPAGDSQSLPASQMLIHCVASHAIGGAHVVFGVKIGKRPMEIGHEIRVLIGNGDAGGTALPHTHQPHSG